MLIRFAGLMMLGCVAACDTAPAGAEGQDDKLKFLVMDKLDIVSGRGVYTAKRDDVETRIDFDLPLDRLNPSYYASIEQVAETSSGVVVTIDRYASRAAPDKRCENGREAFVRVFSLPAKKQLLAEPIESCLDGIPAVDPPVTWLGGDSFRIEGSQPQTFRITGANRVDAVP